MKRAKRAWVLVVACALSSPSVASAQGGVDPRDILTGSLALWGTSSLVMGGVGIYMTHSAGDQGELFTSIVFPYFWTTTHGAASTRHQVTLLGVLSYIRRNRVAVGQDVMLGGGESLADIGSMLGVPEADRADFAAAARESRAAMRPLLTDESAGLPELDAALAATAAAFLARR